MVNPARWTCWILYQLKFQPFCWSLMRPGSFKSRPSSCSREWRPVLRSSIVSSFNQETSNQVVDLIKSPPAAGPYEAQKSRLLKLFALDDLQRYEAISNLLLSGDMKPSKLMSNMLALLPAGHEPCFFLKGAFLKRLPADIHAHLLRDDFSDPISFALKADELYQSRVSSSQVYSVSSTPEDQQSLNAFRPSVPNRSCRSATPHASSRQDSRSQSPTMCYYHRSLGSKAKKCRAPCSWSEN